MKDDNLIQLLQSGLDLWEGERSNNTKQLHIKGEVYTNKEFNKLDLSRIIFDECRFKNCSFNGTHFHSSEFRSCHLTKCIYNFKANHKISFKNCSTNGLKLIMGNRTSQTDKNDFELVGGEHENLEFRSIDILYDKFLIHRARFISATIHAVKMTAYNDRIKLEKCQFQLCNIHTTKQYDFHECLFYENTILHGSFEGNTFTDCIFKDIDLTNKSFVRCKFDESDLKGIEVNKNTNFDNCSLINVKFMKYKLALLKNSGACIETADRMQMKLEDDIMLLQRAFSGVWQWIHGFLLLIFMLPYLFIFIIASLKANENNTGPTLLSYLTDYFLTGGQFNNNCNWIFMIATTGAIFYNLIRAILLYKTKDLENEMKIQELPIQFSLSQKTPMKITWRSILKIYYVLFALNGLFVTTHSYFVLMQKMP